jgi:hypothetical protein
VPESTPHPSAPASYSVPQAPTTHHGPPGRQRQQQSTASQRLRAPPTRHTLSSWSLGPHQQVRAPAWAAGGRIDMVRLSAGFPEAPQHPPAPVVAGRVLVALSDSDHPETSREGASGCSRGSSVSRELPCRGPDRATAARPSSSTCPSCAGVRRGRTALPRCLNVPCDLACRMARGGRRRGGGCAGSRGPCCPAATDDGGRCSSCCSAAGHCGGVPGRHGQRSS